MITNYRYCMLPNIIISITVSSTVISLINRLYISDFYLQYLIKRHYIAYILTLFRKRFLYLIVNM